MENYSNFPWILPLICIASSNFSHHMFIILHPQSTLYFRCMLAHVCIIFLRKLFHHFQETIIIFCNSIFFHLSLMLLFSKKCYESKKFVNLKSFDQKKISENWKIENWHTFIRGNKKIYSLYCQLGIMFKYSCVYVFRITQIGRENIKNFVEKCYSGPEKSLVK